MRVMRVSLCASQSDRWLRQAELMDGWTLSTIDTAIAFRFEDKTKLLQLK